MISIEEYFYFRFVRYRRGFIYNGIMVGGFWELGGGVYVWFGI